MRPVLSASQVRAAERELMAQVPDGTLMQRASFGLAVLCADLLAQTRGRVVGSRVCILAGSGGNAGDALWAGSFLASRGCAVFVVQVSDHSHEEASAALLRAGGRVVDEVPTDVDLVLDGIVGIGGHGPLRPAAASAVSDAMDSGALIVAVDIPSGVDADTGLATAGAVMADVTVTFGALKPALVLNPLHCGHVEVVDIGLSIDESDAWVMQSRDVSPWVPEPDVTDYKYSRGVAGIAAGSSHYPGAGLLTVLGARHANVGMVRMLDRADGVAAVVVERCPDVVVDGTDPAEQSRVNAWACGPGFSGTPDDDAAVAAVLRAEVPVVLDAGALDTLARRDDVRATIASRTARGLLTVITPHEGEFVRLSSAVDAPPIATVGRLTAARELATRLHCVVVLKGPGTVIASPHGSAWIDVEGTEVLGTAGSGDVLSGILAAVLAGAWARDPQSDLVMAVAAGVWLHGCAGRLATPPATALDIAMHVADAVAGVQAGVS
jgi:hydroxyethylthiazole kinase-like uncharacterized protein yjeF